MKLVTDWSGRYLRELLGVAFSDAQLAIATHPLRPQLVIAGAGSGKTAVMAARVVHLVAHHRVPPAAVLGLTFTNKAAGELAARIRQALATLGEDPLDEQPTVLTYHAYAASLVADHALRIGREPVTALLGEAGRWQLAHRVVRAAAGPFAHLDWTTRTVAQYLLELDAELAEHLVGVAPVRACDRRLCDAVHAAGGSTKGVLGVAAAAAQREELVDLVEAYRQRKLDLDLVDFGDQLALAAQISRQRPEVGSLERGRFAAVLLDEYQDTGVAQRSMLAALYAGGHPVTAVGDPCQSIYGWRGASVGNLLRFFEHFPPAASERHLDGSCAPQFLMTNYRGGGRLLNVANAVSATLRAPAGNRRCPYVAVPVLEPEPTKAARGSSVAALHATVDDEARWVAEQVERAIAEEATSPGEVAVLCRRRADFATLHAALVARGLPVEVADLGGLLSMPEVADVVATLEVLAEPTANGALIRLLTGPRWRIGPRDLAALGRRATRLVDVDRGSARGGSARGGTARGGTVGGGAVGDLDDDLDPALRAATEAVDRCDVVALVDALEHPGDPAEYSPPAYQRLRQLAAELGGLRRLLAVPVVDAVSEVIRAIGLDVEIEAAPDRQAVARTANLAAFLDHATRFVGVEGEADLAAFLDFLAAAADVEHGLDVGAVSAADTVKLLTVHKAKGLEWDVVAVPGLCTGTFPSSRGRSRWTSVAKVLPYQLRGDRDDLPADPELTEAALATFRQACRDEDADEERRLAYVAVTRARRRLIASGYRWGRSQLRPKDPSPYLLEVRERCLAGDGVVEVWVDEPGEANPLAAAVADVTWPAPYDHDDLAHRRDAAALVREFLDAVPDAGRQDALLAQLSEQDRATALGWRRDGDLLLAELAATQPTTRVVALPRSLTTSQLVMLREDPAGLAQSLARPMPRQPSPAAARGTAFHAWVQRLFHARPLIDELPGAADADRPDDAELRALQEAFARSPYGERTPYAVEAPFELVLGGRLIRGRIDAVYQTEHGYDVIDYKTGLRPRDPVAAALQLAVYRLAWAGIKRLPTSAVGAAFLYVATGELVRPALLEEGELAAVLADPPTTPLDPSIRPDPRVGAR